MIRKHALTGIMLAATLLGMVPALSLAMPSSSRNAQEGVNLLQNGGFEADWSEASSHLCLVNNTQKVIGNIFTPPGWVTWFRHEPGTWDQPEVTDTVQITDQRRTRSGIRAMKLFTFWRDHDAGFYQVVSGLEPGSTVQFSAYAEAWSCNEDNSAAISCGDKWSMVFQVGIAPNGVADPFSPHVIWSQDTISHDEYRLIGPVTAQVGAEGKVAVFLRSKTKWANKHQDAYWDDTSLVMTSPGTTPTATPLPPPPTATSGPSPTPRPTPTPRPDGATVHIVESGDTLFGISLMYGVTVERICELNNIEKNDLLGIDQELVISLPSQTPTPTPLPPPPTPAAPGSPATPVTEGGAGGASICVLAYHDRNSNTFRDDEETEELLPNVEFTVADASGVVNRYTSDGVHEPHCFTGLAPGAYRVIQNSPAGYTSSGPAELPVAVAEGTSLDIQFGNVRSETSEASDETTEPAPVGEEGNESASDSTAGRIFATVAKVSGIMVLILAAGVAVLFVINRRRM